MNYDPNIKVSGRVLTYSESTKRRNPELFKNHQPVAAGVCAEKPEPNQRSQGEDSALETIPKRLAFRITFTTYRKRILDEHDNARHALKPLADAITEGLGFKSDDCANLEWCYHQIRSRTVGTHVLIEEM